jgi:cobalamin synthase
MRQWTRSQINGQTGDVLGATAIIAETLVLSLLSR